MRSTLTMLFFARNLDGLLCYCCFKIFRALGAHAVSKFYFRMFFDIGLDLVPKSLIVSNIFAPSTHGE